MQDKLQNDQLSGFTTPHLADACLRAGVPVRCAPASLRGVVADPKSWLVTASAASTFLSAEAGSPIVQAASLGGLFDELATE